MVLASSNIGFTFGIQKINRLYICIMLLNKMQSDKLPPRRLLRLFSKTSYYTEKWTCQNQLSLIRKLRFSLSMSC